MFSNIFNPLSETFRRSYGNWINAAQNTVNQVGARAFALFKTYVADPIEQYTIGDLRTFQQQDKWNEDGSFRLHNFGLLGSVADWRPKSTQELIQVLNELDQQPNGRASYRSGQMLIKSSSFVLAETGALAKIHRKEMLEFLKPYKYAQITWDLIQKPGEKNASDLKRIAMQAVAKGLLGIGESSIEDYISRLQELGQDFKNYSQYPLPAALLHLNPSFRKKQKIHQKMVEDLLKIEIQQIKHHVDAGNEEQLRGLLAQEVIKKIQQTPNAENLHQDPDLKSLILLLLAVDNLEKTLDELHRFLWQDAKRKQVVIKALQEEIEKTEVIQDNGNKIEALTLMNKMPVLHGLYLKCLTIFSNQPILARYVQKGIKCGDHQLPPRTYLFIQSPMGEPDNRISLIRASSPKETATSVFSEGNRKCPGRAVSEAIFKAIVVNLVSTNRCSQSYSASS